MIIFDEIKYAENILRNGINKRTVMIDFSILAKYLLYYEGMEDRLVREKMLELLKNSNTFIPINYLLPKIDTAITYAKSENLKTARPISIYKEEIEDINKLPNDVRELAIVYLFMSKWAKDERGFFINQMNTKDLLGKTSMRNIKLQSLNYILEKEGFIKFKDTRTKERLIVLKQKSYGEEAFRITDFDHPILHYKQYLGEKISNCEICGCLIPKTNNRLKYCKSCAKTKNIELTLKRKSK